MLDNQLGILVVSGCFLINLALTKACSPTFEQTQFPITSHLIEIVRIVVRRRIFKVDNIFHYFLVINSTCERIWSFIWRNFNILHQGWFVSCVVENVKAVMEMFTILIFVALENGVALYFNKFESSSHTECFVQIFTL